MNYDAYLDALKEYGVQNKIPNISKLNATFIRQLIFLSAPRTMLEIGTANGYSSIHFAQELMKCNGHLTTIEFSKASYDTARNHFETLGLQGIIDPIFGNALEVIPQLDGPFEFVFIDGMKRRSRDFLDLVREKVPQRGIVIIDDVIKFHDKMIGLWEYLSDHHIHYSILPIDGDDGILLIIKE